MTLLRASLGLLVAGLLLASGASLAADAGTDAGADAEADAGPDAAIDAPIDAPMDAPFESSDDAGPFDASDFEVITYRPDTGLPFDDAGTGSGSSGGCSCELAGGDGPLRGAEPAGVLGALGIALTVARRRRRPR